MCLYECIEPIFNERWNRNEYSILLLSNSTCIFDQAEQCLKYEKQMSCISLCTDQNLSMFDMTIWLIYDEFGNILNQPSVKLDSLFYLLNHSVSRPVVHFSYLNMGELSRVIVWSSDLDIGRNTAYYHVFLYFLYCTLCILILIYEHLKSDSTTFLKLSLNTSFVDANRRVCRK